MFAVVRLRALMARQAARLITNPPIEFFFGFINKKRQHISIEQYFGCYTSPSELERGREREWCSYHYSPIYFVKLCYCHIPPQQHAHFQTAEAYFLNQTSFHHAETGFFDHASY
jgi:hypothetical protein